MIDPEDLDTGHDSQCGCGRPITPTPHPTLLRRAVLLCSEAAPEQAIQCDADADGLCPVHENGACALWYVPWADARRAASLNGG